MCQDQSIYSLSAPIVWQTEGLTGRVVIQVHSDGLMQAKRNSIANTLELRLSCTNPSTCGAYNIVIWNVDWLAVFQIGSHLITYCDLIFMIDYEMAVNQLKLQGNTGLILGVCPANERRRYNVMPSLIGWAQT